VKTWKLEDATARFSEVAHRALAHHPQRITLGERDAVVVVNGADYAALRFAVDLVEFIRRSTSASAVEVVTDQREPMREMGVDDLRRLEDA
jgi:hypothetical protein